VAILVGVRRYDCYVVRSVALILAWLPGSALERFSGWSRCRAASSSPAPPWANLAP